MNVWNFECLKVWSTFSKCFWRFERMVPGRHEAETPYCTPPLAHYYMNLRPSLLRVRPEGFREHPTTHAPRQGVTKTSFLASQTRSIPSAQIVPPSAPLYRPRRRTVPGGGRCAQCGRTLWTTAAATSSSPGTSSTSRSDRRWAKVLYLCESEWVYVWEPRVPVYLDVWEFGCLRVWVFGCLSVWMFECLKVWKFEIDRVPNILRVWLLDSRVLSTRNSISLKFWSLKDGVLRRSIF